MREVGTTVLVAAVAAAIALQTDETGPILAFAGALIVAFVTWVSADRRQEHALAAETERQKEQLEAERARQKEQLDRARALADLSDLRNLLDTAGSLLHRASSATGGVGAMFLLHELAIHQESPETMMEVVEVAKEIDALSARLAVRLGRDHEVTKAFAAAAAEVWRVGEAVGMISGAEQPEEHSDVRRKIEEAGKDLQKHRRQFETAATALAGSRLSTS